ncbi:PhnE/PtxC family ABC transporter permease [Billgrantia tianxiuensis]|uniref:PhnE/PtxC family ABC transporter permease n=1 Tax=Billgrantia tianxiuensis TaxID=2497861 RepID=UPI001F3E2CC3|nr:hypothetical protein [Halomonas tianxiuensis]
MSDSLSAQPPSGWREWWRGKSPGLRLARHTLALVALAVLLVPFADLAVHTRDPWGELGRMAAGLAWPAWGALESPFSALGLTVAVALWGTLAGVILGFPLALLFARSRLVRAGCAFVRAIHELFWALLFLQVFGLSALTALAALAIPYAGIFAKVYAEILEQTRARRAMLFRPAAAGWHASSMPSCRWPGPSSPPIPATASSAACAPACCSASSACRPWASISRRRFARDATTRRGRCCGCSTC